jgi:hypothetical protein
MQNLLESLKYSSSTWVSQSNEHDPGVSSWPKFAHVAEIKILRNQDSLFAESCREDRAVIGSGKTLLWDRVNIVTERDKGTD